MKASQEIFDTYRSEFFRQGSGIQRQLRVFMALIALAYIASSNLWQAEGFRWTDLIQPFSSLLALYFSVFIRRAPGLFSQAHFRTGLLQSSRAGNGTRPAS